MTEKRNSVISLEKREFIAVLRSILVFKLLEVPKMRLLPKVLMVLARDALNTINLDADLPSGELSSRLILKLIAQVRLLLLRLLSLLPDMDLFVNKMDSLLLLNQKFFKTVITISKFVPEFQRKYSQLS